MGRDVSIISVPCFDEWEAETFSASVVELPLSHMIRT
jgi:hypothetical protein